MKTKRPKRVQVVAYLRPDIARALGAKREALGGTLSTSALVSMLLTQVLEAK
jgi:hypothetical protein